MGDTMLVSDLRSGPRQVPIEPNRILRHRTLFLSDTHLGTRSAKAELLADFLAHNDCRTLYLVGDIIDGWCLAKNWFWPESHSQVFREILRKVQEGTRVIFIPGNHDEVFRDYCGISVAGVEIRHEAIHDGAAGKRFLVCHGDQFDTVVAYGKLLARLGDWTYDFVLSLSLIANAVQRRCNLPHWSLAAFLKHRVANATRFIADFEKALTREARGRGFDGVICGHIHHAAIRNIDGILYANDGDWVESCSALAEDASGRLKIIRWTELTATGSPHQSASEDRLAVAA